MFTLMVTLAAMYFIGSWVAGRRESEMVAWFGEDAIIAFLGIDSTAVRFMVRMLHASLAMAV